MPIATARPDTPRDLLRRLDRRGGLPLRPASARRFLAEPAAFADPPGDRLASIDPGWALGDLAAAGPVDPRDRIASNPWWGPSEPADRLWRHSVAASSAARRLAVEAGDPDPEAVARLALLARLGWWALAAEAPEVLGRLLAIPDPARRRLAEREAIGIDAGALGRRLAERWGADPALADVAGRLDDDAPELVAGSADPGRLALVQKAHRWADRTPWALFDPIDREVSAADPRLRLLIAEVQVRCAPGLVDEPASPHEERLARDHAGLLLRVSALEAGIASRDRLLGAIADHAPGDSAADWADRAALAWCEEPGVNAARVAFEGSDRSRDPRPPSRALAIGRSGPGSGELLLWDDPDRPPAELPEVVRRAWDAWADQVADRDRLAGRLEAVTSAVRDRSGEKARARSLDLLESLAEFAAGAGHELNNPLAVILGRAQLLLGKTSDPDQVRSLRAIITQSQRAHRILRDLIYVARPPTPRPRDCAPGEVLRSAVRDLQAEADARGVSLRFEIGDATPGARVDPEALRHLADVLIRNALEASPSGTTVRVDASATDDGLSLSVRDQGSGLSSEVARHLLDPFFCGREAGRGLGMGLPRAARFLGRSGGGLTWRTSQGQGSVFRAYFPLAKAASP